MSESSFPVATGEFAGAAWRRQSVAHSVSYGRTTVAGRPPTGCSSNSEAAMLYRTYPPDDRTACLAIFDSNAERYFSPDDRAAFEHFLDAPPGFFGVLCDDAGTVVACGGIGVRDEGRTAVL